MKNSEDINANISEQPINPNQQKKAEELASSKKAVKVAAKTAANYYAPKVGGAIVDAAAQSEVGQKILDTSAQAINEIPGMGKKLNSLNKKGVIDTADNLLGSNPKIASNMRANSSVPGDNLQGISNTPDTAKLPSLGNNNINEDNINNTEEENKGNSSKGIGNMRGLTKSPIAKLIIVLGPTFFILIIPVFMIICVAASGNDFENDNNLNINSSIINTTESSGQLSGQSLADYLLKKGSSIEEFNDEINSLIESAGKGTRAGVVAAAASITSYLSEKYNIRLPYEWGGGHGNKITLAKGEWGSSLASPIYANGRSYLYSGLDCSGFVSWAIYNGGYNFPISGSEDFLNYGTAHNMNSNFVAKPGDLIHQPGHIMIIIGVDEDSKTYTVAEAAGGDEGMRVKNMPFKGNGSNQIIDMSDYYNNSANVGG